MSLHKTVTWSCVLKLFFIEIEPEEELGVDIAQRS
jgi:hypothetical protein